MLKSTYRKLTQTARSTSPCSRLSTSAAPRGPTQGTRFSCGTAWGIGLVGLAPVSVRFLMHLSSLADHGDLQLATAAPLALESPQNASELVSKRKLKHIEGAEVQTHNKQDAAWVVIDGVVLESVFRLPSSRRSRADRLCLSQRDRLPGKPCESISPSSIRRSSLTSYYLAARRTRSSRRASRQGRERPFQSFARFRRAPEGERSIGIRSKAQADLSEPKILPALTVVGLLDPAAKIEVVSHSEDAEEIEKRRAELPEPEYVINLGEFEALAKRVLGEDSRAWRFFSSYADDGASTFVCLACTPTETKTDSSSTAAYHASKSSFSFLRFLPRVNVPVSQVSMTTTYLDNDTSVPFPIIICPTGASASGHPDGELNMTRSSSLSGIPQIVSTMSSIAFQDLAAERDRLALEPGRVKAPLWWQLYIMKDRKESERRIKLAKVCGAEAIVITVDVASIGKREADAPRGKLSGGVAASGAAVFTCECLLSDPGLSLGSRSASRSAAPHLGRRFSSPMPELTFEPPLQLTCGGLTSIG